MHARVQTPPGDACGSRPGRRKTSPPHVEPFSGNAARAVTHARARMETRRGGETRYLGGGGCARRETRKDSRRLRKRKSLGSMQNHAPPAALSRARFVDAIRTTDAKYRRRAVGRKRRDVRREVTRRASRLRQVARRLEKTQRRRRRGVRRHQAKGRRQNNRARRDFPGDDRRGWKQSRGVV